MQVLSHGTAAPHPGTRDFRGDSNAIFLADRMNKLSGDDCSLLESRGHRASWPLCLHPELVARAEFAMAEPCGIPTKFRLKKAKTKALSGKEIPDKIN